MIEHLTNGKALPPEVLDQIVTKTDGVPLFIEELTKAVLEAPHRDAPLAVPDTLQASLMARLDRLPAAKVVAQIGQVSVMENGYAKALNVGMSVNPAQVIVTGPVQGPGPVHQKRPTCVTVARVGVGEVVSVPPPQAAAMIAVEATRSGRRVFMH